VGLASVVATAFILAGSYGVADAAVPSFFHGHGRDFPRTLSGTVTAVGTGSFTLGVRHDRSLTVLTTFATKFRESGSPDPVTSVATGEHVVVLLVPPQRQAPPVSSTTTSTTVTSTSTSSTTTTDAQPSTAKLTADRTASLPPLTAATIDIILGRESGRVTARSSSAITLSGPHGSTRTVEVSSSTSYFEGGMSVAPTAVTVGDFITAYGQRTGIMLDAINVDVYPAHPKTMDRPTNSADKDLRFVKTSSTAGALHTSRPTPTNTNSTPGTPINSAVPNAVATVAGVVQSVSGNTIVVRSYAGAAQTVTVTSSTTFRDDRGQVAPRDIVKGEAIRAYGTESGGVLTASVVVESQPALGQPAQWSHPDNKAAPAPTGSGRDSGPGWRGDGGSTRSRHQ
jgi:Domain of unknown function (DUF5666)